MILNRRNRQLSLRKASIMLRLMPKSIAATLNAFVPDDETFSTRIELLRRAVVADKRISQRDDLSAIGRVGQNFLVARHARVKDNFAFGRRVGAAEKLPAKGRAVFENQFAFHVFTY